MLVDVLCHLFNGGVDLTFKIYYQRSTNLIVLDLQSLNRFIPHGRLQVDMQPWIQAPIMIFCFVRK